MMKSHLIKPLPNDWKHAKLGEVCTIYQGYGFPKNIQGKRQGRYPFYKVGDISRNVQKGLRFLTECEHYIDDDTLKKLRAKAYPINTIVFAKIGEALKLNRRALISQPAVVDNNAVGLKAKEDICNDLFLFYFLKQIKLEDYSRATTVPSVRKSDIEDIGINIPPLSIQNRIVVKLEELFSELDKSIEELKTAQQQLKVYRQTVLKWAFEGKLTNENMKEGELPEGWKIVPFKTLIKRVRSGTAVPPQNEKTNYPILRSSSVRNGKVNFEDVKFIADISRVKLDDFIQANDLLFTRLNGSVEYVGNCIKVPESFPGNLIYPDRLFNVKLTDLFWVDYLQWYFESPLVRQTIERKAKSTAGHMRISTPDITEMPIVLCPNSTKHKVIAEIESRLSVCDKIEETITTSLKQADALRKSILKQAFEGRLNISS